MTPPPEDIPVDQFSEYAMSVENEDYPKTDFTQFQFRGRIDTAAMVAAHRDALKLVPIYSCHLVERRHGLLYKPWWVYDVEVENPLHVADCRSMADDPFDPMAFSTRYYAQRTRRCIDLEREFPFNCSLLRATDDEWVFSILYHHSAMDARKAYRYLTALLSLYHERVTGQPPEWTDALGMAALKRRGGEVTPVTFGRFAQEQLADMWWHNRGDRVANVASEEKLDYRQVKGRHSLRAVIDDPRTFDGIMALPNAHGATLNDLLFTVARRVLTGWNAEHHAIHDRFRFMLITSLWGRTPLPETAGAGVSALTFVSDGPAQAEFSTQLGELRSIRRDLLGRGLDIALHRFVCSLVDKLRIFPLATRVQMIHAIANSVPAHSASSQ